ncbi:MAG: hypothetical protein HOH18_03560 [Kordiimonadaceae bacterium]|nr:hypothetical protein [Kordiimonadaceae bacterium]
MKNTAHSTCPGTRPSRYFLSSIGAIFFVALTTNYSPAQQQEEIPPATQAQTEPKAILFPSGIPGPYFPTDDEIGRLAQERLSLTPTQTENNAENPTVLDDVVDLAEMIEDDNSVYGTLSENDGGLSKNIWQPSSLDTIEKLLVALNLPSKSPIMDQISQKLLLSIASAPTGEALEITPLETTEGEIAERPEVDQVLLRTFINLRINELIERGNLTDLVFFIQNLPEATLEESQQNTEILMLGGDLVGACQMARSARSTSMGRDNSRTSFSAAPEEEQETSLEDIFWLKMIAFCRVLEENNAGAEIALDLLNEQGNIDFLFYDLVSKLMEQPETRSRIISSGLNRLDPLNYTILSLLDQPIEANLIENSPALIVSALVINPNMTPENRFQAAVKSYLSGGVSAEVLRNIYDLQEFTVMEYNNAVRMAEFDDRPIADVLLYQAAKQSSDFEKAEILDVIWKRALENNDLPRKAELNIETLLNINPSSRLMNHTHQITRGLLLGGEIERAIQWYDFARRNASGGNGEATRALINIWPLAIIASDRDEIPWSNDILELWWNGQMVLSPENRDSKAALFYALAEAFGHEVAEDKWAELITENKAGDAKAISLGVWRELIKSVGENKPAQSILLSLIAMGQEGPGSLDASGISTVVRVLRSFGLEAEARKVAIEALVANGF